VKFINLSPKGSSFSMVLDPTLNGENMRFWLTFFIGFKFAHFLSIWHEEDIIQQLKAWSFRMWKNLVHMQSNSDTIGRWSSITFFLYTLYKPRCLWRNGQFRFVSLYYKYLMCQLHSKYLIVAVLSHEVLVLSHVHSYLGFNSCYHIKYIYQ
jgi:hypothetical protein